VLHTQLQIALLRLIRRRSYIKEVTLKILLDREHIKFLEVKGATKTKRDTAQARNRVSQITKASHLRFYSETRFLTLMRSPPI